MGAKIAGSQDAWRAVVKAGGGLTIGSDPKSEVQEAKLKVRSDPTGKKKHKCLKKNKDGKDGPEK